MDALLFYFAKPDQIFFVLQSAALPILLLLSLVLMGPEYRRQALFRRLLWSLIPIGLVFAVLMRISPRDANANPIYLADTTALQSGNWMLLSLRTCIHRLMQPSFRAQQPVNTGS